MKKLKLDRTTVTRRVNDGIDLGYLRDNSDGRRGKAKKLERGDPLPELDTSVLPAPRAVAAAWTSAPVVQTAGGA